MKAMGIVRKLDALGRIVLPKELRRTMDLKEGDPIEIFTDGDKIVLGKYAPTCIFCSGADNVLQYRGKNICNECANTLIKNAKDGGLR